MAWFQKPGKSRVATDKDQGPARTEGLWSKCEACGEIVSRDELVQNLSVCPHCGHHMVIGARQRLEITLDPGSFAEADGGLAPQDPLGFTDNKRYKDRVKSLKRSTGELDAFVSGRGLLFGRPVSMGAFAFEFMGGLDGERGGREGSLRLLRDSPLRIPAQR